MTFPGNDLLQEFENQGGAATKLGVFLRRYVLPTIQNVAQGAAVGTTKAVQPPDPPQALTVTPLGNEHVKLDITHNAPIIRGARYFTEISANEPSFKGAMIHDHGPSRSSLPVFLPTNSSSSIPHTYYAASYVQYPGGVRHIVVPPDVQVIGSFPAGRDAIRLGLTATAQATRGPDGVLVATRISLAQPKP